MNRLIKTLALATIVTALFASMQISVLGATIASSAPPESSLAASSHVASSHVASSNAASSHVASSQLNAENGTTGTSRLNDVAPINENARTDENARANPHTGAESVMIPGAVALLAAATAAVTLTGKKK